MLCSINTTSLVKSLKTLEKICKHNKSLPILQNVKITVSENEATISATDLENTVMMGLFVSVAEFGEVLVNCFQLLKFAKTVKSNFIKFETDGNKLTLSADKSRITLNIDNGQDYPIVPNLSNFPIVKLPNNISELMDNCLNFINTDYARNEPVHLVFSKKQILATNAFTLAIQDLDISEDLPEFMIEKSSVKLISELFKKVNKTARLETKMDSERGLMQIESVDLINGNYNIIIKTEKCSVAERWAQCMPKKSQISVTVKTEDLIDACKCAKSFTKQTLINLLVSEKLIVSAIDENTNEIEKHLDIINKTGEIEIRIDASLLLNTLELCSDTVTLNMDDKLSPVVIENELKKFKSMTMPCRK